MLTIAESSKLNTRCWQQRVASYGYNDPKSGVIVRQFGPCRSPDQQLGEWSPVSLVATSLLFTREPRHIQNGQEHQCQNRGDDKSPHDRKGHWPPKYGRRNGRQSQDRGQRVSMSGRNRDIAASTAA